MGCLPFIHSAYFIMFTSEDWIILWVREMTSFPHSADKEITYSLCPVSKKNNNLDSTLHKPNFNWILKGKLSLWIIYSNVRIFGRKK